MDAIALKEIGKTLVFLDGYYMACRKVECNLGSFIADGYVDSVFAKVEIIILRLKIIDSTLFFDSLSVYEECGRRQWSKWLSHSLMVEVFAPQSMKKLSMVHFILTINFFFIKIGN